MRRRVGDAIVLRVNADYGTVEKFWHSCLDSASH